MNDVPPTHLAIKQLGDTKQVKNVRSNILEKTHGIYNLHELVMDMSDFIDVICMYPDVIYVYGHRSILDVLDRLLLMNSTSPQPLSYDTTFQLGDFYVSMLSFRHILFKEAEPVLLACFLIHERMFQACHDQCFETCCKLIPSLHKCKKPTVIDEEHAFVNTVKSYLPPLQLRCWNHIMRDICRGFVVMVHHLGMCPVISWMCKNCFIYLQRRNT